jgi:hypothetical protein
MLVRATRSADPLVHLLVHETVILQRVLNIRPRHELLAHPR